jgi:two-component system response regulator YesN
MIIEDEAIERKAFRKFIEDNFSEIELLPDAENGLQGIEFTHHYRPDILILDINIPELDGLHTLKMLRASGYKGKIIIHSAYNIFEYARNALNYGADAFLLKPETNETLKQTISLCICDICESRKIEKEKDEKELRITDMSQYIKEDIITQIITNEGRLDRIHRSLNKFSISIPSGFFITVGLPGEESFIFLNNMDEELPAIKKTWKDTRKALQTSSNGIFSCPRENSFSMFIPLSSNQIHSQLWYNHLADETVKQIKEILLCNMELTVHIGIGCPYERIENFYKSYQESMQALSLTTKDNPVVYFKKESEIHNLNTIWNKFEQIGCDWQTEKTFDLFLEILNEYLDLIEAEGITVKREHSMAFWEVVCEKCRKTINGWEAAKIYHQNIEEITQQLMKELNTTKDTDDIRRLLMRTMVKNIQEIHVAELTRPNVFIQNAVSYIDKHYAEDLSLENVASSIGISQFYFSHIFKKYMNCSFIDYITGVRIKKMIQLLKEKQYSTKELAFLIGYGDVAYFCKVVKKVTGKTVGEIKNSIRDYDC